MVYLELQIVDDIADDFDVLAALRSPRKNKRVAIRVLPRGFEALSKNVLFSIRTPLQHKDHAAIGRHDAIRIKRQVGNHDIAGCFDRCDSSSAGFLLDYRFLPFSNEGQALAILYDEIRNVENTSGKINRRTSRRGIYRPLNRRCIIRDPVASRSKLPNVDDPPAILSRSGRYDTTSTCSKYQERDDDCS